LTENDAAVRPQLYDHYAIEQVLGRGAMGVVYLARDVRIGRLVALKTLQEKHLNFDSAEEATDFLQRFHREAEMCGSLIHPNIITLYEVGYASKQLTYLAMEYVDGESLLSLLRRNGRLDLETALKITDDVLQGLAYAHDRGVIHRDIKPANILVTVEGQAKVADFGVARSVRASLSLKTQEGQLLGTPYYMAPEHITGRGMDARADLFSVGVVLFEMLSGAKPFGGPAVMDTLFSVVNHPTPNLSALVPTVPRWAAGFVERLLEKSPEDRFLSASAASRELRRLLSVHRSVVSDSLDITVGVPVLRATSPEDTPTTPLAALSARRLRARAIPGMLALGIVGSLMAAMVTAIVAISQRIDDQPTVTISQKTLSEFARKREMLREAQILYNAGAYEASWLRFNQYLQQYPGTPAALQGRGLATQAIEAVRERSKPAVSQVPVLEEQPKPKRARRSPPRAQPAATVAADTAVTQPEEPEVPVWERIRSFFRRLIRRPEPPASAAADLEQAGDDTATPSPETKPEVTPGAP
jgi:serine/threonine protein kinase